MQPSLRKSLYFIFAFSASCFLAVLSLGEALFPGAILVAVAVGRFADSRNGWRAHDDNTEAPNRDGVDTEDCAHLRAETQFAILRRTSPPLETGVR